LDNTYTAVDNTMTQKTTSNNKTIRILYFVKRDNSKQLQNTDNKTPSVPYTKHKRSAHYSLKLWASLFCSKLAIMSIPWRLCDIAVTSIVKSL